MGVFRNRWFVVGASTIGLICSSGPVNIFAFGVFLRAVTQDLHIGRGTLASAMLVTNWISAFAGPVLGMLLDRYGARKVILTGIVLFAITTAAQSYLTASIALIYTLYALKGITGSGASPVSYAFVVAKWFDRRRGLALGIAMAGVGLGTSIIPPIAAWLIENYGWRSAYIGLAVVILVVAGIPVTFFIREPNAEERAKLPHYQRGELPGLTMREVLRSWRFYGLTFAFFLGVIALNGTLTQIVAMLMDRGYALQAATSVLAASGIASLCGRMLSGWCVDRWHAPYVAVGFFTLPMIGTALLGSGAGGFVPLAGAILCGLCLGAEIDLMGFCISRYFGLKAYGKIFGTIFGVFAGATGVGPFLSGRSFDLYHTYGPAFALYELVLVVACVIFVPLGAYRYPVHTLSQNITESSEVPA